MELCVWLESSNYFGQVSFAGHLEGWVQLVMLYVSRNRMARSMKIQQNYCRVGVDWNSLVASTWSGGCERPILLFYHCLVGKGILEKFPSSRPSCILGCRLFVIGMGDGF